MKNLMIEVKNLSKSFKNVTPLKDVNAKIYKGDIISIIGPSGTGKSTFLRCLNKLETATSGEIIVDGVNILEKGIKINKIRQKMGMVFQSFNLFSHKTIIENVMMAQIDLLGKTKEEAYKRAMELLEMVGLKDKAFSLPEELSGGQKQRAAIARTLSVDPEIILFDEPTSALDPTMVGEVLTVIKNLADKGLTLVIVTHEMNFARNVSNRVFFMDEGIIYEEGTPEQIFEKPTKDKTRQFISKLKVAEFSFDKSNFDFGEIVEGIRNFGKKNMIPGQKVYNIQLVAEEICFNLLFPHIENELHMCLEYSQETGLTNINIRYKGKKIKFDSEVDEIQKKFIDAAVKSIHEEIDSEYNIIKIEVR